MNSKLQILVADDDEAYAKELCACINTQDGFTAAGYALNGAEALELTQLIRPDAVILDLLMPVLDGIGFLRRLEVSDNRKKPIIIMMSHSSMPKIITSAISNGADYFMVKPQSCRVICDTIKDLRAAAAVISPAEAIHEDKLTIENHVSRFIRNLGIPAHLDGYKYIRDAIMLATADMSILTPITKKLYPMIAERYGTTMRCVERAIRHAISVSWLRGSRNMFNDIFGYSADDSARRPTNSEYIAMAADDFRLRCKYGAMLK